MAPDHCFLKLFVFQPFFLVNKGLFNYSRSIPNAFMKIDHLIGLLEEASERIKKYCGPAVARLMSTCPAIALAKADHRRLPIIDQVWGARPPSMLSIIDRSFPRPREKHRKFRLSSIVNHHSLAPNPERILIYQPSNGV
jgi:hypothetical protein